MVGCSFIEKHPYSVDLPYLSGVDNKSRTILEGIAYRVCYKEFVHIISKSSVDMYPSHIHFYFNASANFGEQNSANTSKETSGNCLKKISTEEEVLSSLWGRRIFAVSSGSITDEMIMEYIENQDEEQISVGMIYGN